MIEFHFICSDGFSYTQNKQLIGSSVTSHHIEIFRELFRFVIGFGLYKFCRAFDGASFKKKFNIPSFSEVKIYTEQKRSSNVSSMKRSALPCKLLILSIRKTIRTDNKKSNHIAFVALFTAHLLEKTLRFYHLPKPRYMRNKECYSIMDIRHYSVKRKDTTFSCNTLFIL